MNSKYSIFGIVMQFPNINIIRENNVYNALFGYLLILFDSYLHISSYLTNY